jgi:sugar phosphate isomerase/epimerase
VPPRLHLGINTCFAAKRWPEPEQWIAIVTEELGLRYCQLSLDMVDPLLDAAATSAYARQVRKRAVEAGLLVHSTFSGLAAYSWSQLLHPDAALRAAAVRWYERAITFSAELGAGGTGGHLGAFSVRDAADQARRQLLLAELGERIGALTLQTKQHGLRFLLCENMAVPREFGHTIEEAQALVGMAAPDGVPLVLCLDVGHPCALGTGTRSDDPLAWLAESWARTPVLHLQQTDHEGDRHWPFTPRHNAVGAIRADAVVEALRQWPAGDVYLFLEVIHPFEADEAAVLDDLRISVRHWREALAQQYPE